MDRQLIPGLPPLEEDDPMSEHMDANGDMHDASLIFSINIENDQEHTNNFSVFQDPGLYSGISEIHSRVIFNRALPPKSQGANLTLTGSTQHYAGVQDADVKSPKPGQISSCATALQPISLSTSENGSPNVNTSSMSYDPISGSLGLSMPNNMPNVLPNAFQIIVPSFNSPPKQFNAGSALIVDGRAMLSNFVSARPLTSIECQPVLRFHVVAGRYCAGTTIDFHDLSARSAVCDFTTGFLQASVTYRPDGSWDVQMS